MMRLRIPRTIAPLALGLLVAGCERAGADVADSGEGGQLPPPAAALTAEGGISLDRRLELLDADLARVIEGALDSDAQAALLAAEATTDRLLEDEPAAAWLATGYLVEARLRQIQALADRIVAEFRRGVQKELVLEDVAELRLAVGDLRNRITAQGNGPAPAPLDSLLAGSGEERTGLGGVPATSGSSEDSGTDTDDGAEDEPGVAPEGGPLGEPIQP